MKKVFLIHAWGKNHKTDWCEWYDWVEKMLIKKGFEVKSFDMPDTQEPTIDGWVKYLEENISPLDIGEKTYFIGHSIGCQTIMRFLEKLHKHYRIAGCVFVAGWFDLINLEPEEFEIAKPWISSRIHFDRILDHCNNFLSIFSDNDPYVHLEESQKFKTYLGSEVIIKHHKSHFEETGEIPEILNFIK